jgi:serine/threonine protein kinase
MPTPDHDLAGGRPTTDPLLGFTAEGITLESMLRDAASSRTYLGRTVDGQAVQVWVMAAHLANDVAFLARLHQEAQQLVTLRHVHVETCLGQRTWSGPDGRPLVVLLSECSAGVALADLAPREPLPVRDVLRVFQQACAGLAAAHRMGIVHGDVTPDAILVTTGGAAKLRAFALGVSGFSAESVGHRLIGSPDFMAPEVGRGQQPSSLSDLYAIGAVLLTPPRPRWRRSTSTQACRYQTSPSAIPNSPNSLR